MYHPDKRYEVQEGVEFGQKYQLTAVRSLEVAQPPVKPSSHSSMTRLFSTQMKSSIMSYENLMK